MALNQHFTKNQNIEARKPTEREYRVATGLLQGKSPTRAVSDAGYGKQYAKRAGRKVAKNEGVRQALLEIGSKVNPVQLGVMCLAGLEGDVLSPPEKAKERLAVWRTGLEVAGMIGGPSQLHLHQHTNLPPGVEKMLEAKMRELLAVKGEVIHGELSEGAESQGQSGENHEGVQNGRSSLRVQDGAISKEP